MQRLAFIVALCFSALASIGPVAAYSYAAAGAEPLLDGREVLFAAVTAGDWTAATTALAAMQPDIDYLDGHEDPGIGGAFTAAIAARDIKQVQAAFARAGSAEIERRLNGARDNLNDYRTAKVLVVKAQRFYTAVAGDLAPDASQAAGDGLKRALAAIGNPGVFGVGARKPDAAAFATARSDVLKALGRTP
jgi:hypothetical protein